jgi:hypothetical protein
MPTPVSTWSTGVPLIWRGCPTWRQPGGSLDVTQLVAVDAERFLAMVEIRAERNGMTLHNFAAFLGRTAGGQVHELWMVDARPAYSDAFWT